MAQPPITLFLDEFDRQGEKEADYLSNSGWLDLVGTVPTMVDCECGSWGSEGSGTTSNEAWSTDGNILALVSHYALLSDARQLPIPFEEGYVYALSARMRINGPRDGYPPSFVSIGFGDDTGGNWTFVGKSNNMDGIAQLGLRGDGTVFANGRRDHGLRLSIWNWEAEGRPYTVRDYEVFTLVLDARSWPWHYEFYKGEYQDGAYLGSYTDDARLTPHTIRSVGVNATGRQGPVAGQFAFMDWIRLDRYEDEPPYDAPPVILKQPLSKRAFSGDEVLFEVQILRAHAESYQWQKNGINIDGATSSVLKRTLVDQDDEATYRVVVTNDFGSVTSKSVQLKLVPRPPVEGAYLWLKAEDRVGEQDGRVVWWGDAGNAGHEFGTHDAFRPIVERNALKGRPAIRFEGDDRFAGAPGGTLTQASIFTLVRFNSADNRNGYLYTIGRDGSSGSQMTLARQSGRVAASYDGRFTPRSSAETLPGNEWLITEHLFGLSNPRSQHLFVNGRHVLYHESAHPRSVDASVFRIGDWLSNRHFLTGDIAEMLVYDRLLTREERWQMDNYLRERAGFAPLIRSHPKSVDTVPGDSLRLETAATGGRTLFYQWRKNGVNLPGEIRPALEIPQLSLTDAGEYDVEVSGAWK